MIGELPGILSAVLRAPTTSELARKALSTHGIAPGAITANELRQCLDKTYVDDTKIYN